MIRPTRRSSHLRLLASIDAAALVAFVLMSVVTLRSADSGRGLRDGFDANYSSH